MPSGFPPGMSYSEFMNLPPEDQMTLHQEMIKRNSTSTQQKIVKNHRFNGLLEWILERDGHEFLIEVDREYIRD